MDYYERRLRAFKLIDKLLGLKTPLDLIKLNVQTTFGLSPRVVDERINLLSSIQIKKEKKQ